MKTVEEIIARIAEVEDRDMFGFERSVLINYLPFEQAQPYLREGVTAEEWNATPLTEESVVGEMREYMEFAWDKALNERGLSADRSVQKMQAWLWLLGDAKTLAFAEDDDNYPQYGKPILSRICEVYGFEVPAP